MISKSTLETTLLILMQDLSEFKKIDAISEKRIKDGYSPTKYCTIIKNNIKTLELLIVEYKKYLKENY